MTGEGLDAFEPASENGLIVRAARFFLLFAGVERFADQSHSGGREGDSMFCQLVLCARGRNDAMGRGAVEVA